MSIDRFLIQLDQTLVTSFKGTSEGDRDVLLALSSSDVGYYKWDYKENVVWLSDVAMNLLGIDKNFQGTMFELLQSILDQQMLFKFVRQMMVVAEDHSKGKFDLDLYSSHHQEQRHMRIAYDFTTCGTFILGTLQDIHELKLAQVEAVEVNDRLIQILKGMPLPIYYYDHVGNIIFNNESIEHPFEFLNPLVEKHICGHEEVLDQSQVILDYEVQFFSSDHKKYKIRLRHAHREVVFMVHRIQIKRINDTVGILFIHEDITEDFEQENKIKKVLKTNELTIKIKDIVDQDVDLQVLFDFVLKHMSSVIPSAKRACILKIDHQDDLYMAASYGYDADYHKTFKMPFKSTFAYLSFNLDYSKSIIINDVQETLSKGYPQINENQNGFVMASNMSAPIIVAQKLYGILCVDSDVNHIFDAVDLNLIDYIKIQLERSISKHKLISRYKAESLSDPLTGVYNRRHLMDVFDSLILKVKHESKSFALVIFDIDDLKLVNDAHGHLVGDAMLKIFANKILKGSRSDDILSRYGGDEFVGLFWDISTKDLLGKIDAWQEQLAHEMVISSDPNLHVKFSYGISFYPGDGEDFEELLSTADHRMYAQKHAKKGKLLENNHISSKDSEG